MKTVCGVLLGLVMAAGLIVGEGWAAEKSKSSATVKSSVGAGGLYALEVTDIEGKTVPLSKYAGQVALVVNTASRCGLTPQYESLQKLQGRFEKRGFTVLGFPSNDFFAQEPGTNEEIKIFCEKNYQVSFPLFSKARVKGGDKQAVYRFLTEGPQKEFHGEISWNFEKFLVGRDGRILARFKPRVSPGDAEVVSAIEKALAIR